MLLLYKELCASNENISLLLASADDDGYVPIGDSHPPELVDQIKILSNDFELHLETIMPLFVDQPTEIDRHIDETSDAIHSTAWYVQHRPISNPPQDPMMSTVGDRSNSTIEINLLVVPLLRKRSIFIW